jgi:hypothetical protein
MPLVLAGSTSGSTTIQATDAVTQTITLPNNTGTVLTTASTFGGTGPAFSATTTASQTISNASFTKIQFNSEEFDTNSNYDSATNYRFTPTVAGYYQVNGCVSTTAPMAQLLSTIYKNGSEFKRGTQAGAAGAYLYQAAVSALVYFNGSTDYVELYIYQQSGGNATINGNQVQLCYFQASLARSA